MKALQRLAIILPIYDEEGVVGFLRDLACHLEREFGGKFSACQVILVDDGSQPPVPVESLRGGGDFVRIYALRHNRNLGQGAALQAGIELAKNVGADIFVTMDADGQHQPRDLAALIEPVCKGDADIAFGTRFGRGSATGIPLSRYIALQVAVALEKGLTGLKMSDAHNGFRAFNRTCAELIRFRQNRMAHATEFKFLIARGALRYIEVPVNVVYTKQTLRKGRRSRNDLSLGWYLVKAAAARGPTI